MKTETIEGNKLIAEFMGWVMKPERALEKDEYGTKRGLLFESLPFDNDWNELMPVVDKIEDESQTNISIVRNFTQLVVWGKRGVNILHSISIEENTKIKSVWLAAIEFIKWYNQNK